MVVINKIFITITLLVLFPIYGIQTFAQQVNILHKGCRYTVNIPAGWDTIPNIILKEKFPQLNLDAGMYPMSQKDFFSEQYVLIGFSPTINTLNAFSFEQVADDIRKMSAQTTLNSDTLSVISDSIVPVNNHPEYWVNNYLTIRKDSSLLKSCQTLYLSKFGYITLMAYQKKEAPLPVSSITDIFTSTDILQVEGSYKYIPPQKKSFPVKYLFISLGIGVIVYIFIAFFSKKRT